MSHGWNKQGPWYKCQCLGYKQTLFTLGQHARPTYLRGTRCGVENSVAELRNVPRAHLAMQFKMRLQTVVGEIYSEVGYNFNFEKP